MAIHCFDTDIAEKYGLEASIILNNIYYWVQHNEANEQNFYDGHYWTFNSVKAFNEIFPYISERKIRNALKSLEDEGILITGNYNKVAYDRTKWYAITEKGKCILSKRSNAYCQNEQMDLPYSQIDSSNSQMDLPEKANGNDQNGEPIPDNKPLNNQYYKPINKHIYDSKTRHKYGEYNNVLLSDEDFQKLANEFPFDYLQRIERLSEYIASTGKSYKNHLATIRAWARKEKPKNEPKKEGFSFMDIDF